VGAGAVLSHETAAHLHRLLPHPARPAHVSLIGRSLAPRPDIRIHRTTTLRRADIRRHQGLAVTGPARTVLDLASGRTASELEPLVAEALRMLRLPERALREQLELHPGGRGTATLRAVLDGAGGPAFTRSKAERRLLHLLRSARLPPPESCARIGPYEIDLLWPEERLAVELTASPSTATARRSRPIAAATQPCSRSATSCCASPGGGSSTSRRPSSR
jgi:hypothetical protein